MHDDRWEGFLWGQVLLIGLRDGRWQLALSQQVTIQVPASPSAVVSKQ